MNTQTTLNQNAKSRSFTSTFTEMMSLRAGAIVALLGSAACGVSNPQPGTGGVNLGNDAGDAAPMGDGATAEGGGGSACPSAFAIIETDSMYLATNVSIVSPEGVVMSESFISSSSGPAGSSGALSGDVVAPFAAPSGGKVVLIDRTTAVITFVDLASAAVTKQIGVGTGFTANPHDYVEVGPHKAYVTRYKTNGAPGAQKFDQGGDIVVLDTDAGTITGEISLGDAAMFPPSPDRMALVGGTVWVSNQRFAADFSGAGDARIVGIDSATDTTAWSLDLPGIANCGGPTVSPSGAKVALACSGFTDAATGKNDGRVGIVVLDATTTPPREIRRYDVSAGLGALMSAPLAFTSENTLMGVAPGDFGAATTDLVYALSLDASEGGAPDANVNVTTVVRAGGQPYSLGDLLCAPGCNTPCLITDADKNALRRLPVVGGVPTAGDVSAPVDPTLGLSPRTLGAL